ncbi:MAG: hypothetical protein GY729_21155 [Desulfobacteraceae bacterium]|nr:hypothetical protein [Desulfobacteraceae bacterium]
MRFLVWKKPEDNSTFGLHQNLVYAVALFIILNLISFSTLSNVEGSKGLLPLVLFFYLIPGSACISGLVNGFYLMMMEFPKASKTNFVIAGVSFIVGSACTLMLSLN